MNLPPCTECGDPVERPNTTMCDWCSMTPAERETYGKRAVAGIVLVLVVVLAAAIFAVTR